MLKTYVLTAFRALRRDAFYSGLNGFGLALALACCVLIGLFVRAELAVDRFHEHADEIVVVAQQHLFGGSAFRSTATPYPLHEALAAEAPAARQSVFTTQQATETPVSDEAGEPLGQAKVLAASAGFFEMFSFPLLRGDARTVLASPDAVVLTEALAERLFGQREPMGQTVRLALLDSAYTLTVRGLVAAPPIASTITFDAVMPTLALPESRRDPDLWGASMWRTYARLLPGATVPELDGQLDQIAQTHLELDAGNNRFFGTALPAFYLSSLNRDAGFRANAGYLRLFSAAALLTLLLGGINYVNLATARATKRGREVGVRKALGAGQGQVALQFLAESLVLVLAAAALGLALGLALLPAFNDIFGSELTGADLDASFLLTGLGAALLVGLLAGAYPAAVLSRFQPSRVLRGTRSASGRPAGAAVRRVLVVAQFVVAIGLLAVTAVVLRQVSFAVESDLGFEEQGLVWLPATHGSQAGTHRRAPTPWQALRDAALAVPGVERALGAEEAPGRMQFQYAAAVDPERPDEIAFLYRDAGRARLSGPGRRRAGGGHRRRGHAADGAAEQGRRAADGVGGGRSHRQTVSPERGSDRGGGDRGLPLRVDAPADRAARHPPGVAPERRRAPVQRRARAPGARRPVAGARRIGARVGNRPPRRAFRARLRGGRRG